MLRLHMGVSGLVFFLVLNLAAGSVTISFSDEPENTTVAVGKMAQFHCYYTGTKDAPRWKINGQDYDQGAGVTYLQPIPDKEGYTLQFEEVKRWMDGTTVSCYFLVDGKEISSSTGILHVFLKENITFLMEPKNATVNVRDIVNFTCHYNGTNSIPVWKINTTLYTGYAIAQDPDYTLIVDEDGYTLRIMEAKLWMDNTRFSCSFTERVESKIAILQVKFDLIHPEDVSVLEGSNTFINCNNSLLYDLTIEWCINGACYVPSQLPREYIIKRDGLLIPKVYAGMNETRFQCSIQYKYLLKTFFLSEIGVLTVMPNNQYATPSPLISQSEKFNLLSQNISFDINSIMIAWQSYPNASMYRLSKAFEGRRDLSSEKNYSSSTHTTDIQREDLIDPSSGNLYSYFVEAKTEEGNIVASNYAVRVPPNVYSENQTVRPHDNLCIPVDHDVNGCEVIWPDSEGGDCACGCGDILNCVCVNSTGYNVKSVQSQGSSEIQICWMNLTQDKNLTHIFAAIETRYTSEDNTTSNPTAIRTYSSAYIIIIADVPGPPHIDGTEVDQTICISSVYDGNDPIQEYMFIIEDITGHTISWNVTATEERGYCTVITIKESYIHPSCNPFILNVSSRNQVGSSLPVVKRFVNTNNSLSSVCVCYKLNVKITMKKHSENSLKIRCVTDYNLQSEELIHMELQSSQGSIENGTLPCTSTYYIYNLTADIERNTNYFVSLYVRDSSGNPCDLLIDGKSEYSLDSDKFSRLELALIIAFPTFTVFLTSIIIITILILCIIIWKKRRTSATIARLNRPSELENSGTSGTSRKEETITVSNGSRERSKSN